MRVTLMTLLLGTVLCGACGTSIPADGDPPIGYVWLDDEGEVHRVDRSGEVVSIHLDEEASRVADASGGSVVVQLSRGPIVRAFTDGEFDVVHPGGTLLGSSRSGDDLLIGNGSRVEVVGLTGELRFSVPCPGVQSAAWDQRDTVLVTVCDGNLYHYERGARRRVSNPPPGPVVAVTAWGDGFAVLVDGEDESVVYRTPAMQPQKLFGELGSVPREVREMVGGVEREGLIALTEDGEVLVIDWGAETTVRHTTAVAIAPLRRKT